VIDAESVLLLVSVSEFDAVRKPLSVNFVNDGDFDGVLVAEVDVDPLAPALVDTVRVRVEVGAVDDVAVADAAGDGVIVSDGDNVCETVGESEYEGSFE
jgi:hypothetical protein